MSPKWGSHQKITFFFIYIFSISSLNILLSICGFAFPFVCFIAWPTKNPNALSFPDFISATDWGLFFNISTTTSFIAPSSEIWIHPFSSIINLGDFGFSNNSTNTFLPIAELIVPLSINSTNSAKSWALKGISDGSISFSLTILEISEIIQLLTALGFLQISTAPSKIFE